MKVIIFGTGSTANNFINSLKCDVDILAFADNDLTKVGNTFEGIKIIKPSEIYNYCYDCIVIASQYNKKIFAQLIGMGIDRSKIFQFFKFLDLNYNYLNYKFKLYKDNPDYKTIITGISYTEFGLIPNLLNNKAFSFANGSQDLYYDYKIIEHIIKFTSSTNIKYVIIGLCYYSFQYDLSLSSLSDKVSIYFSVLGDCHNLYSSEDLFNEVDINNDLAIKLLKKNDNNSFEIAWGKRFLVKNKNLDDMGKKQAFIDCNKNYPKTVIENIVILKNYLKLLKDNNIKPIVVVFPASKYYTKFFSKNIEEEFFSILKKVRENFSFQYIDYFRSELFNDCDFADVSHLNSAGADKFTKILNQKIEW